MIVCGQSLSRSFSSRVTSSSRLPRRIASNWTLLCNLTRLPSFVSSPVPNIGFVDPKPQSSRGLIGFRHGKTTRPGEFANCKGSKTGSISIPYGDKRANR